MDNIKERALQLAFESGLITESQWNQLTEMAKLEEANKEDPYGEKRTVCLEVFPSLEHSQEYLDSLVYNKEATESDRVKLALYCAVSKLCEIKRALGDVGNWHDHTRAEIRKQLKFVNKIEYAELCLEDVNYAINTLNLPNC